MFATSSPSRSVDAILSFPTHNQAGISEIRQVVAVNFVATSAFSHLFDAISADIMSLPTELWLDTA
jgi:hypothetical protein